MGTVKDNPYGIVEITDIEFDLFRRLVYQRLGINLTEVKRSLLVNRLQKILRERSFTSFKHYYNYVTEDKTGEALSTLADRISTNHTFFLRESKHLDFLKTRVLPEVTANPRARSKRMLRVWSAGCSSGEEAFTLMMIMLDYFGEDYCRWDAGLLATDISEAALSKARAGIYERNDVAKLPIQWVNTYFNPLPDGKYRVCDRIRREIVFRRFNLMNTHFPFKQPFDIIFCRNVMIYFDEPTREQLISRFYRFTEPGGYFFVGHSESLRQKGLEYDYVMPAVYKKGGSDV